LAKKKSTQTKQLQQKASVRNRALRALARMRRTGGSLAAAARAEHIDPRTVRKLFPEELKQVGGRIEATEGDRRRRDMLILTPQGTMPVAIYGSKKASQLGLYFSAVGNFLRSGDADALREFEGQSIAGHALITDLTTLTSLAEAGALKLDEVYATPEASP
jgi:hypothetical protein